MTRNIIYKGYNIDTANGFAVVKGFNGSVVDLDMYTTDDNYQSLRYDGKQGLTLHEVGLLMKEVDGRDHKVAWMA